MKIELKFEAKQDLADGARFYDRQRPGLGDYFVDCLFSDLAKLEKYAGIHETEFGVFRRLSETFPYAIYYRITANDISVVAILDSRQDPALIAKRFQ